MTLQVLSTYTSRAQVIRLFSDEAVKDRLDDVCELQSVAITGTPTSGSYTLTYNGATTVAIPFNGGQNAVEQALRGLTALPRLQVLTVGTTPNFTHRIKFIDILGDASTLTSTSGLNTGVITIATLRTGDATAFDDAIIMGCEEVNKWAWRFYYPANLGQSNLVNQWSTWLSAYYLSQRRGNPPLFETMREEILAELKQINFGNLQLPGIPMRRSLAPVWSVVTADPRYTWKVLRVEKGGSTRTPQTTQPQNTNWNEAYTVEW